MTITELINCSVEQLEAMTFAECEAHFAPFFSVTRPSKPIPVDSRKSGGGVSTKPRITASDAAKQARLAALSPEKQALLKAMGIMK